MDLAYSDDGACDGAMAWNAGNSRWEATCATGSWSGSANVTATSSAYGGGSDNAPVSSSEPDTVVVTYAEWDGANLTVWATSAHGSVGPMDLAYNRDASCDGPMAWNAGNSRWEVTCATVIWAADSSVTATSGAYGGGNDTAAVVNGTLDTVTVTKADYDSSVGGGTLTVWATHTDNDGVKTYEVDYGASIGNAMTWNVGQYELSLAGVGFNATVDVYSNAVGGDTTSGMGATVSNVTPDVVTILQADVDGINLVVQATSAHDSVGPMTLTYTDDASCNGALAYQGGTLWSKTCATSFKTGSVTVTSGAYGGGSDNTIVNDTSGGGGVVDHDTTGNNTVRFGALTSETCGNCHSGDTVYDLHGADCALCHTAVPALNSNMLQDFNQTTGMPIGTIAVPVGGGTCTTCHESFTNTTGRFKTWEHHNSDNAQSGNCVHCHDEVREDKISWNVSGIPGSLMPQQTPCAYCHTDFERKIGSGDGAYQLKTFDFAGIGYNAPVSSTISDTHTIPNLAGGTGSPIDIHDTSVCFTCHDGTDMFNPDPGVPFVFGAPLPINDPPIIRPYHASIMAEDLTLVPNQVDDPGVPTYDGTDWITAPYIPLDKATGFDEATVDGGAATYNDDQTVPYRDDLFYAYHFHPGRGGVTDTTGTITTGSFNMLFQLLSPYASGGGNPKYYQGGGAVSGTNDYKNAYKTGSDLFRIPETNWTDTYGQTWNFGLLTNVPYVQFDIGTNPVPYWVTMPKMADKGIPLVVDKVRINSVDCAASPTVVASTNLTEDHYLGSTGAGSVTVNINGAGNVNMTWNGGTSRWESTDACSAGNSVVVTSNLSAGGSASTTAP